jgi:ABC-type lipoprotein export system ATPase subunit
MKVSKIELKGYNQFKDLTIDLTYPKGHPKEGKPLDKICIIGQGGTGKTTLLRLIKWFASVDRTIGRNVYLPFPPPKSVKMDLHFIDLSWKLQVTEVENPTDSGLSFIGSSQNSAKIDSNKLREIRNGYKSKFIPFIVNFPTEILTGNVIQSFENNDNSDKENSRKRKADYIQNLNVKQVVDFAVFEVNKIWDYVLKDVHNHIANELLIKNKIGDKIKDLNSDLKDFETLQLELSDWISQNPNPLFKLADECLDPVLLIFGLKVKREIDKATILDMGSIQLQTLSGEDVPFNFWSTGTKQLMNILLPLYELKPQNALVLIDEPERSLYPDLQRNIINEITKLGENCQFFFATHSPIIASSFDPWEIIELKFNETFNVIQEEYFSDERHVDNYKFNPRYMRWDTILKEVFDVEHDGNEAREIKLSEFADVNQKIKKKQKNKLSIEELKNDLQYIELTQKYKKLADELRWEFTDAKIK